MKVISISIKGVKNDPRPEVITGEEGSYYAFSHGERGRGRWEVLFPLSVRDFPCEEGAIPPSFKRQEFSLVSINKKDAEGNDLYLLGKGEEPDGRFLVFWHLSPGFRGYANYKWEGSVQCIAKGSIAQGDAGRMGGAMCPVMLVDGPCRLWWERGGRLYGTPAEWVAEYDDKGWRVFPAGECAIEDAALTY